MKYESKFAAYLRVGMRRQFSMLALGLMLHFSASADTTTLSVAATSKGTSNTPVTMQYPVTRSGDTSYAAVLNYHTIDGTALAGTDYTAAASRIVIPAGSTTATIPVSLAANTTGNASQTFQLLLDSAAGIGPTPSFATQQSFATGSFAYFVTAADLNGDGKPDLIVANFNGNSISVLLNTTAPGATTPSFATQQAFAVGTHPISVAAADVNGDGKPDLIVANYSDGTVTVLLNTTAPGATTPTFAAPQTFATEFNPVAVTAADVNGDGNPDLIVVNFNGTSSIISVLLNTTAPGATTPSFATQQPFATGTNSQSVAVADLNGDGKPDVIVANNNTVGTISVLFNTTTPGASTPTFAAVQTFATGMNSDSVAAADVNGDGKPDLIVANSGDKTVSVLLNTTTPGATTASFAAQQTFGTGSGPVSVAIADLNGDGKPDLIVGNGGDNTFSMLLNTTVPGATTASFAMQQSFAAGTGLYFATVADLNGDGKPDLIAANAAGNTVSVLLNTQYQVVFAGSPATGTIVHDYIFSNGFE